MAKKDTTSITIEVKTSELEFLQTLFKVSHPKSSKKKALEKLSQLASDGMKDFVASLVNSATTTKPKTDKPAKILTPEEAAKKAANAAAQSIRAKAYWAKKKAPATAPAPKAKTPLEQIDEAMAADMKRTTLSIKK